MTNLENLRVVVIPTETQNGIDQRSDYDEIMHCPEAVSYPIPYYFKAQNDEELPSLHWSFLVDIENKIDLTGENIKGLFPNLK